MATHDTASTLVFVGSYTHAVPHAAGVSRGIEVYRLDGATGALTEAATLGDVTNPAYLTPDPSQQFLYFAEETPEGRVGAARLDVSTGRLTLLNRQPSYGAGPACVSIDRTGRWVLVANYESGTIAVLPVLQDGRLGEAVDTIQHTGQSVNAERQQGPHAHWIGTDPDNRFVFVVDLGLDQVLSYRLDATSGMLEHDQVGVCAIAPGSGPRHMVFRPDGRYTYIINELSSTITTCACDAVHGELRVLQTVSAIPAEFVGTTWTAAVRMTPSGRFVYGSNRGHDSIVIFESDPASGLLTYVGHEETQGHTPRDFNIDPTGTFLLAANQDSNTIVSFRIDGATGRLQPTGHVTKTGTPVCIAFGAAGV